MAAYALRGGLETAATLVHARIGPAIRRQADEKLVEAGLSVELTAFDEPRFLNRMFRARDRGLLYLQRVVDNRVDAISAGLAVAAAAVSLSVLHPALLPVLALSVVPDGWAALRAARLTALNRRVTMVTDLATMREPAAEVRATQAQHSVLARHRQAADQVRDEEVSAGMAQARARTLWCDTDREPDLFWALRGAGGGLTGAVTSFVLATRPAVPATFVECRWPVRHAARVIAAWQRFAPEAPDEINIETVLVPAHGEEPMVAVYGVSAAGTAFLDRFGPDPDHVEIRELPGPAAALVSYPDVSEDIDVSGPSWGIRPGLRLARSEFFDGELPEAAIESLVDYLVARPVVDQSRILEFIPWDGAIARMASDATAFVHRRARFILKHAAWVMRRASDELRRDARRWVDGSWELSHPWGSGLIYPNYPEPTRAPLDPAYHGTNLARLRRVLARYDPDGTFAADHRRTGWPRPADLLGRGLPDGC